MDLSVDGGGGVTQLCTQQTEDLQIPRATFLGLPKEIRIQIYRYLFRNKNGWQTHRYHAHRWFEPVMQIFFVCHQILLESQTVFGESLSLFVNANAPLRFQTEILPPFAQKNLRFLNIYNVLGFCKPDFSMIPQYQLAYPALRYLHIDDHDVTGLTWQGREFIMLSKEEVVQYVMCQKDGSNLSSSEATDKLLITLGVLKRMPLLQVTTTLHCDFGDPNHCDSCIGMNTYYWVISLNNRRVVSGWDLKTFEVRMYLLGKAPMPERHNPDICCCEMGEARSNTAEEDTTDENVTDEDATDEDTTDEDMPDEDTPGEDMPDEDTPGEDMPDEDTPGEDTPGEDIPDEGTPDVTPQAFTAC